MWFKNLMIYRLTKPLDWTLNNLQTQLQMCEFAPCSASEQSRFGWQGLISGSPLLYFAQGKHILLCALKEEKILPSNVVKREWEARVAQLEAKESRALKKTEKQTLKDDVIMQLLPRAFSKMQRTLLWIDSENQLIYVDAASSKRAEDALALLRKSLGSLPVVPLAFANEPSLVLTDWIAKAHLPAWLEALEEAELRGAENSRILCKKQPLENEEILNLLNNGKVISKLALDWAECLSFVFCEDGSFKRLKFADALREKNDDIPKEDNAQRLDADFALMSETLTQLCAKWLAEFGGEKTRLS